MKNGRTGSVTADRRELPENMTEEERCCLQYHEWMRETVGQALAVYRQNGAQPEPGAAMPEFSRDVTSLDAWREWRTAAETLAENGWMEPVEYLIRNYGLDAFEQFCLALLTEQELDAPALRERLAACGFEQLTPAAAISLFCGERILVREMYASFLRGGRLSAWILDPGGAYGEEASYGEEDAEAGPWSPVRLDRRLVRLVLGGLWRDPSLEEYGGWIGPREYGPEEMADGFGEKQYRQWSGALGGRLGTGAAAGGALAGTGVCILCGAGGIGKRTQLRRFADEYGVFVFCVDASLIGRQEEAAGRRILMRLVRECSLCQALLCLRWHGGTGGEQAEEEGAGIWSESLLVRLAERLPGLILLTERERMFSDRFPEAVRITIPMPNLCEAAGLWRAAAAAFPHDEALRPEEFAGRMNMTPGRIRSVWQEAARLAEADRAARERPGEEPFPADPDLRRPRELVRIARGHLEEACRSLAPGSLAGKAVHVPVRFTFDDLVLPPDRKRQLEDACLRVKNRYRVYEDWGFSDSAYGTGLSIAFSGPPGTGKTMAAQVMAGELGMELYKVNLAAAVSKYVGETEKNLQEIFDEAARMQAILFFDEADVLFARRTEVRDSRDRYGNMEAAFLLQKMEEYAGVTVLATNYLQNMDEAFKRRLTHIIDFPFPDRDSRRRIWERATPGKLPLLGEVDLDFLAERFELSGSQIRSSLLNAAFAAAGRGDAGVGMEHILRAVRNEFQKSGRQLTQKDLGEYGALLK